MRSEVGARFRVHTCSIRVSVALASRHLADAVTDSPAVQFKAVGETVTVTNISQLIEVSAVSLRHK